MNLSDAERLFHEALTLSSPDARASFLERACGSDNALRDKVQRLLEAHDQTVSLLPADPALPAPSPAPSEDAGSVIGRYKLLQRIGEGGMGVVYMAEQEEPVRRRVALKIIKLGMDTRAVVARFEAERQALALMDHPNIARVLDGGATETGRPYFVMELVQGVPITEYCDKNKLAASERLKLFIAVCQAIQSAHQKGIIHRDIKPSNVLVTIEHGEPMPKVIDFGIAKATNQKLTEKTLFTNYATMIGTPAYMSPEQAEMTSLDVDTRADIYSLGVLLYELLTGTTPFPAERLRSLGYGEMQRVIVEEEPERPSTRLGTLTAEQKTAVARSRGNDLQALGALLRGDLDWIVMRCLEKDRRRRYETANALATDLQRHLGNEPVTARPPAASYRLQKWVRRNRTVAVATAAVALALIVAAAVSTGAFLRERSARLQVLAAERAREEARRATAGESIRADSLATFAIDLIEGVLPSLRRNGHHESVRQVLHLAGRLADVLTNAPLANARVRLAVAREYSDQLGDYKEAGSHCRVIEDLLSDPGQDGNPMRNEASFVRMISEMRNTSDPKVAEKVVIAGREALKGGITSPDVVASALAAAAGLFADMANREALEQVEQLAAEALRVATTKSSLGRRARLNAHYWRIVVANERGDQAAAADAADHLFDQLRSLTLEPTLSNREELAGGLDELLAKFDLYIFPIDSLRRALIGLPANARELREVLQGFLGGAIAKSGDWEGGLKVFQESNSANVRPGRFWMTQLSLVRLLRDSQRERQLAIFGLTRFGNGADALRSQQLAWQLLPLARDPGFVPVVSNLVWRSQSDAEGTSLDRGNALALLAAFQYFLGHFQEARQSFQEYSVVQHAQAANFLHAEGRAWSCFLQSCIETRVGNNKAAEDAYGEGLKHHSSSMHEAGVTYADRFWGQACHAEIMRREAAALLSIKASNQR